MSISALSLAVTSSLSPSRPPTVADAHPAGVTSATAGRADVPSGDAAEALRAMTVALHSSLLPDDVCGELLEWLTAFVPDVCAAAVYLLAGGGKQLVLQRHLGEWAERHTVTPGDDTPVASGWRAGCVEWQPVDGGELGLLPLVRGEEHAGLLAVVVGEEGNEAVRHRLVALAETAGPAVAHAVAYRDVSLAREQLAEIALNKASEQVETQLRAEGERLLNDLHGVIHERVDPERIVQLAAPLLRAALHASRCIALLATDGEYRDFAACELEFPLDSCAVMWEDCEIVQAVESTLRPVVIQDTRQMRREQCARRLELWKLPTSLLAVPAVRNDRLSAIFIYHHCDGPRTWTDSQIDLARRAADQVATALHNARLYQGAIAGEEFQRTLAEIQTTALAKPVMQQILEQIARHGMQMLGADAGYVWQVDEARQELVGVVGVGHRAESFDGLRTPLRRGRSLALAALHENGPVLAHDAANDTRVNQRMRRLLDCGAAVALPIRVQDEPIGAAVFSFRRSNVKIDAGDLDRAQVVVAEAAQAIDRARLYAEANRRAEEWQVLWRLGQSITEEALDEEGIVRTLVEGTAQILRVSACSLLLRDPDSGEVSLRAQVGLSEEHERALQFALGERVPPSLAIDGCPHNIHDLSLQGQYPEVAVEDGLISMLSVPMLEPGDLAAGALTVYAGPGRSFSIGDLEALSTLASFGLAALGNARRYNRERRIATTFQGPLLPNPSPAAKGLQIALRTLPALREADVGGDYFDTIALEDGRLVVAIGDVAGKGLNAAVQTQSLRWMMRALVHESPEPGKLLTRLNRLLCQYTPTEGFVTLFYGLFDARRRQVRYANAGHLPPLVKRRRAEEIEALDQTGLVLGVDPTVEYEEATVEIGLGDLLALYTDGLADAGGRGRRLEVEGVAEQFRQAVVAAPTDATADRLADGLFEAVFRYANSAFSDDATLMIINADDPAAAPPVGREPDLATAAG